MKDQRDHLRDINAMRAMMEKSSRFLSIPPLACILVGLYALAGAWVAYIFLDFHPEELFNTVSLSAPHIPGIIIVALTVLTASAVTAIYLSYRKAALAGEQSWNATVRRLIINMIVPLLTGGLFIVIMIVKGFIAYAPSFSLLFYGLSLYTASKFTFEELKSLGLIEILLGLLSACFVGAGLFCWAAGFGIAHIVYGIFLHYRYGK